MSDRPLIEVEGLSHVYSQGSGRFALQGISFTVERGEIFGLLGPNGGGKTTAFRVLSTLLLPSQGTARVFGFDVRKDPHAVRARIGVVFQSQSLDIKLTVEENLRHHGHLYGLLGAELRNRIEAELERLGLTGRRKDRIETLSGGLRRRVELAKGLLHRPELLLLDEPTAGLDPGARRDLWEYVETLRRQEGVTILLTTHLLDEADRCSRVGFLDGGRLVALDSPESLKKKLGGEIIVVETKHPEKLRQQVEQRFQVNGTLLGGTLRIERPRAHEFIAQLMDAFGTQVDAVTLARPTLEDVFIRETGHRFWSGEDDHEPVSANRV